LIVKVLCCFGVKLFLLGTDFGSSYALVFLVQKKSICTKVEKERKKERLDSDVEKVVYRALH